MPERIQLSRRRGWRLPPGAMSVARPGPHGNPWAARPAPGGMWEVYDTSRLRRMCLKRTKEAALAQCVAYFRAACDPRSPEHRALRGSLNFPLEEVARLRGRTLACWCPPGAPCHADVLLELANAPLLCERA